MTNPRIVSLGHSKGIAVELMRLICSKIALAVAVAAEVLAMTNPRTVGIGHSKGTAAEVIRLICSKIAPAVAVTVEQTKSPQITRPFRLQQIPWVRSPAHLVKLGCL